MSAGVDVGGKGDPLEVPEHVGLLRLFLRRWWGSMARYHLAISILASARHVGFTRPQRATVAFTCLLVEMAASAMAVRHFECSFGLVVQAGMAIALATVQARPGQFSALSIFTSKLILYGAFVCVRRLLNNPNRRFPARGSRRSSTRSPSSSA